MKSLIKEYETAILFITHDLGVVAEMADRVVVMYTGQIVEEADVNTLFHNPKHNLPEGCRFHPRCKYATEECKKRMPELIEIEPGHYSRCLMAEKGE